MGTEILRFESAGETVSAELYTPEPRVLGGAVVIGASSYGLADGPAGPWGSLVRGYADALARSGFAVLVPDYLSATSTRPGLDAFGLIEVYRDRWQAILADALDYVQELPDVTRGQLGLLGFSLGAHLCLRIRARARVLVAHGAPRLDGIGRSGSLDYAQIHHGEADAFPGAHFVQALRIELQLKSEGVSTNLFAYPGAGHGFAGDDPANRNARELARHRTLECFRALL